MNALGFPLLSLLTFLPLAGAAIIAFVRGDEETVARNARWTALWTSAIVLLLSLILWFRFDRTTAEFQFVERAVWLGDWGIGYHMGVDGLSVLFVLLSTVLTPLCIIASWEAITTRVREYMIAFLVLETMMVGMFCALDFVVFYVFFEGVLIPMFLIIGVWGGPRRVYAAFKFFLYTLLGSVLMLLAMFALYVAAGTTDIPALLAFAKEKGLDPNLPGMARNLGASRLQIMTKIALPASLPVMFAGLRLSLGLALTGEVSAEFVAATNGIGAEIWRYWQIYRIEEMYANIVVVSTIGIVLSFTLLRIQRRLLSWDEGVELMR